MQEIRKKRLVKCFSLCYTITMTASMEKKASGSKIAVAKRIEY